MKYAKMYDSALEAYRVIQDDGIDGYWYLWDSGQYTNAAADMIIAGLKAVEEDQ